MARRARTVAAFGIAALGPFLVDGAAAWGGLATVFRFHGARPLQVESLLATPLLLARLLGAEGITTGDAYGGQIVSGPGASLLAAASGPLALACLGVVVALARRARLRGMDERRWVALSAVALLLAVIAPAKVLSPQFLVWLVPATALLAPAALGLTGVLLVAFLLTGIEFPALYWDFVDLHPGPVLVVVVRNVALAVAFGWALLLMARGDSDPTPADGEGRLQRAGQAKARA